MKLYPLCIAALFAVASTGTGAVDLSDDEGATLRERAQVLQAKREREPSWDGGTRYSNDPQPPARSARANDAAKKTAGAKRKREPIGTKMKRAVKKLPGALVRGR